MIFSFITEKILEVWDGQVNHFVWNLSSEPVARSMPSWL